MTRDDITHLRLTNQLIAISDCTTPDQVVTRLGAMQAQDYPGTLWAIGLRVAGATIATIEQAIADRTIVRTWPMRGTLHFVPAQDARWMVDMLTPRIVTSAASRHRNLELDEVIFAKARELFVQALQGGKVLTRSELLAILDANGIATVGQRGIHICWYWAQKGLLCFGPHRGKEPTFVLLDEWAPGQQQPSREEALALLAERYFISHGPATERDFAWWSGLKLSDARAGLASVKTKLISDTMDGETYWMPPHITANADAGGVFLLPGFDEFMLGYKDRSAALPMLHSQKIVPGNNGMFLPTIVSDGQVAGLWKKKVRARGIDIVPESFVPLTSREQTSITVAAQKYGAFMGQPATVHELTQS